MQEHPKSSFAEYGKFEPDLECRTNFFQVQVQILGTAFCREKGATDIALPHFNLQNASLVKVASWG